MKKITTISIVFLCFLVVSCGGEDTERRQLKIATTTSVENSGLLAEILPLFEEKYNADVDVIAVGTGQALALGESGDVDAVLVHAPALEDEFVSSGFGTHRYPIMYNDFVIVGPHEDFVNISEWEDIETVFSRIAFQAVPFVSRGDNSGTHFLEMSIWERVGYTPSSDDTWYFSVGQGMGATLNFTNEKGIYTLTDRGTFLAQSENLPNLRIVFGGDSAEENPDPVLMNYYSIIPVNPAVHPNVNNYLALEFAEWITSVPIQEIIGGFNVELYDIPLFYPNSEEWQFHLKEGEG